MGSINITVGYVKTCDCRGGTSTTPGLSIRRGPDEPDRVVFITALSPGPVCDVCRKLWELHILHLDGSTTPASDFTL